MPRIFIWYIIVWILTIFKNVQAYNTYYIPNKHEGKGETKSTTVQYHNLPEKYDENNEQERIHSFIYEIVKRLQLHTKWSVTVVLQYPIVVSDFLRSKRIELKFQWRVQPIKTSITTQTTNNTSQTNFYENNHLKAPSSLM